MKFANLRETDNGKRWDWETALHLLNTQTHYPPGCNNYNAFVDMSWKDARIKRTFYSARATYTEPSISNWNDHLWHEQVIKNSWELVECTGTQKDRSKTCNNDARELIDKVRRVCGKLANSPPSSDTFKNNQKVWVETQSSLGLAAAERVKTDHRYFQVQFTGNVKYPWMSETHEIPASTRLNLEVRGGQVLGSIAHCSYIFCYLIYIVRVAGVYTHIHALLLHILVSPIYCVRICYIYLYVCASDTYVVIYYICGDCACE